MVAHKGKGGRAHPREPGHPPSQGLTRKATPMYGTAQRPDITPAPYTQRMGGRRCEKDTHDEKEERGLLREAKGPGGGPAPTPPPTQPKRKPSPRPAGHAQGEPEAPGGNQTRQTQPDRQDPSRQPNPQPGRPTPQAGPGPTRPTSQSHSGSFPHCRTAIPSCIAAKQSG